MNWQDINLKNLMDSRFEEKYPHKDYQLVLFGETLAIYGNANLVPFRWVSQLLKIC